jgi:uncharacterized protein YaiL (DUF2058 family)
MALSLQDQLLKAGLADKKKAVKIKNEKRKKNKVNKKHKIIEVDENTQAAQEALEAKKAKDKALNAKAKQAADEKAVLAQIKQLIDVNKQPKNNGEVVCNFTDDNKIKRLFVSDVTNRHISQGKLAIVKSSDGYEIVPTPVANKIAERDEQCVVYVASAEVQAENQATSEEDDWYADYEIPDDLSW